MHEAILYEKLEKNKVKCTACHHKCLITPKHTGICGVRQNLNGKLYLLVYGKSAAFNIDPVEKKPLYHFLPQTQILSLGTVGCNFACKFCQNWEISQASKEIYRKLLREKKLELMEAEISELGYELPPQKIVDICIEKKLPSIAYTYNEPVIFTEYLYDTSKIAKKHNLKNVLVSSGYESEETLNLIRPYVDAMNIDLKSFSDDFYRKMSQARLDPVLDTIKNIHKLGIWIEITTLIIPKHNDSDKELKQIAEFIQRIDKNIPWHVTAFHPNYKMPDVPPTTHAALLKAHKIGKKAGLNYVYTGNIPDEKHSGTYCPNCNALLIKRNGYFVTMENLKEGKCSDCNEKIAGVWK